MKGGLYMEKWKVRICDILNRELFKHAKPIAGINGLDHEVKWTHILEVGDVESLINGGELILTTGSGTNFDSPDGIGFIEKLRSKNVSGICIELGTHVRSIHPDIITYGNSYDFPIIIFEQIVKFVDITQDLHTLIINQHHQMLHQLNSFSQKINEFSLLPNGILKILRELYLQLNHPVALITDEIKSHYYPPMMKDDVPILQSFEKTLSAGHSFETHVYDSQYYFLFPIKGLGHTWGYLWLKSPSIDVDEFALSMIDRVLLAIAQIMLRNRTVEERKQNQEEEIVRSLLKGDHLYYSGTQKFLPEPAQNLNYRLVLIHLQHPNQAKEEDWEEIKLQQTMIIRSLFKRAGFIPAMSVNRNEIAVIASFYKHKEANKDTERFTNIVKEMKQIQEKNVFNGDACSFGISNIKHDYGHLSTSYREAKTVTIIQSIKLLQTYFFEKIGVYRILLDNPQQHFLEAYIQEYLGPILSHDKDNKSELLETVSTYINCLGSKKETAEQLFIVRQTLYHRLEKIEQLLGEDFMEPINRQAIELALAAYKFLKKSVHHKALNYNSLFV